MLFYTVRFEKKSEGDSLKLKWENGIETSESIKRKGIRNVFLGRNAKYCRYKAIYLSHPHDKPQLDKNKRINFGVIKKYKKTKKIPNLDNILFEYETIFIKNEFPKPSEKDFVVRIITETNLEGRCRGNWSVIDGQPEVIAEANTSSNRNKCADDLIVLHDQEMISVIPSGGIEDDCYFILNDSGKIKCGSAKDYYESSNDNHHGDVVMDEQSSEEDDNFGNIIDEDEMVFRNPTIEEEEAMLFGEESFDKELKVQLHKVDESGKINRDPDKTQGKPCFDTRDAVTHQVEDKTMGV